jgi:hypothetical protein
VVLKTALGVDDAVGGAVAHHASAQRMNANHLALRSEVVIEEASGIAGSERKRNVVTSYRLGHCGRQFMNFLEDRIC